MPKQVKIAFGLLLVGASAYTASLVYDEYFKRVAPPDFSVYAVGAERKQQFFDFMGPLVETENARIARQRSRLLAWQQEPELNWWQSWRLERLAEAYKLDANASAELIPELLLRVDTLPAALALAQAAKESGWGTSRFAQEGNNFFGQWCFVPGCGMVPQSRDSGASHEVADFRSAQLSVRGYLRNLNTHYRYEQLRQQRAQLRAAGSTASGQQLAEHLLSYSIQGLDYVRSVQQIIRVNQLESPDPAGG